MNKFLKCLFFLFLSCFLFINSANAYRFGKSKYTAKYDEHFRKYAKRYFAQQIEWNWFKAQAIAESNLNNEAQSWVNAKGVMQIMPKTYESIKEKLPDLGDITDPRWNIAAGVYYDKRMWKMWKADRPINDKIAFMFASYNAGHRTILRAQRVCKGQGLNENLWENIEKIAVHVKRWRQKETLSYIDKIFNYFHELADFHGPLKPPQS